MAHEQEMIPAGEKLDCFWRLIREWSPYLTPMEFKVTAWLMANTIGWNKLEGGFYLSQIIDGVRKRTGGFHSRGIGESNAGVRRAIEALRSLGVLATARTGRNDQTTYRVNLQWNPENLPMGLPTPKRLKSEGSAQNERTLRSSVAHPPLIRSGQSAQNERLTSASKEQPLEQPMAGTLPGGDASDALRRTIQQVTVRTPTAKPAGKRTDHWSAFKAAWTETFPRVMLPLGWTVREKAIVKNMAKRWPVEHGTFAEFLDWSVRNWSRVITVKFAWMTMDPPPATPAVGFLSRFMNEFASVYCERALHEFLASQPEEQKFYHQLRLSGKSHDEARLEIAKRAALAADREERAKDKSEAARLYRMAERIRKEAEALPRFTAENPHPSALPRAKGLTGEDHFEQGTEVAAPQYEPWEGK